MGKRIIRELTSETGDVRHADSYRDYAKVIAFRDNVPISVEEARKEEASR